MGACCDKMRGGSGGGGGSNNPRPSTAYNSAAASSDEEGGNPRVRIIHTRKSFDDVTKGADGKLIVADFHAPWCGPCQLVSPKVDIFADEFAEKVLFIKVNVDEHDDLASTYGISCMPTFILFKKGEKIDEFSGANVDKLKQLIQKYVNKM